MLCLILALCCLQAFAFETHGGLRVGATVSKLAGEDWEDSKDWWEQEMEIAAGVPISHSDYWGMGFSIGLFYEVSLFRFLAIQPELFYTTYHGGMKLQNDTWSSDWVKLGTIYRLAEASAVLKLRFSEQWAVFSGPLFMYRFIAPKEIIISPDDRDSDPVTNDSVFKRYAFAVVGGIEFRTSDEVLLDIRYNYNLDSLDDYGGSWEDDTVFHGVIASVGFLF